LDSFIGRRNYPSMPVDHAAALGNSKIPDRVKLRQLSAELRPDTPEPHENLVGLRRIVGA
ncbi:hypothetical protein, partial [Streptomyces sp. NPDC018352]|uniref:hypothetical protein n=1 Tax=Streptomyces sp. NPDC018352 TaxID=3157194 RepID=UPI0033C2695A